MWLAAFAATPPITAANIQLLTTLPPPGDILVTIALLTLRCFIKKYSGWLEESI
jgi:hypothetical protein